MRSPIWRTNISRSTFSRRARNSPSVIIVPRRRYGSRYSVRLSERSDRPLRSRRLRVPRSLRSARVGRSVRSRTSRTLTTVTTPSSSTISPGVTPSPVARRRRRRRCVAPSAPSSVESEFGSSPSSVASWLSTPSAFGLRRPRPPRRRRRLRPPRESSSSEVAAATGAALSMAFSTGAAFAADFRGAFGAFSSGAA